MYVIISLYCIQCFDAHNLIGDPKPVPGNPADRVTNGRASHESFSTTGAIIDDGCRTWVIPPAKKDNTTLTHPIPPLVDIKFDYAFEEIQMYGSAHLAVSSIPLHKTGTESTDDDILATLETNNSTEHEIRLHFVNMIGDRSGTVHLRSDQTMDLKRFEIDLPFSLRAYTRSFLGLAPHTFIHGVTVWMHGESFKVNVQPHRLLLCSSMYFFNVVSRYNNNRFLFHLIFIYNKVYLVMWNF